MYPILSELVELYRDCLAAPHKTPYQALALRRAGQSLASMNCAQPLLIEALCELRAAFGKYPAEVE